MIVLLKDFCMNGRMAVTVIPRSARVLLVLVSVCALAWIAGNNKAITSHLQRCIIESGLGVSNVHIILVVDAEMAGFHKRSMM
jgi:hypothetical protein